MLNIFKSRISTPSLRDFPLESYSVDLRMDRLVPGVDNVRHDVLISPKFQKKTTELVKHILAEKTKSMDLLGVDRYASKDVKKDEFKRVYRDVVKNALNWSKAENDFNIFLFANISITKFFIQESRRQITALISSAKDSIRSFEKLHGFNPKQAAGLAQKMTDIQKERKRLYRYMMIELLDLVQRIYKADLNKMIESIFGAQANFPHEVFFNPLLQVDDPRDDYIMMEKYILLGDRSEDTNRYEELIDMLFSLFHEMDKGSKKQSAIAEKESELASLEKELSELKKERSLLRFSKDDKENNKNGFPLKEKGRHRLEKIIEDLNRLNKLIDDTEAQYQKTKEKIKVLHDEYEKQIENWICHTENISILFDYFSSQKRHEELKKQKGVKEAVRHEKVMLMRRHKLFDRIYKKLDRAGLVDRFVASYEMIPSIPQFCPPLNPHQILDFFLNSGERKKILDQSKRFYPGRLNFDPLYKKIEEIKVLKSQPKKGYLMRFLVDFARYHRDLKNYELMIDLMGRINILEDDKTIELSRVNKTLYEILLPEEEKGEDERIISHVVIKADVRGSTKITQLMNDRGLNPASHFSMNFFNPISEILSDYDALKIFIEGDALILAIFEKTGSPAKRYGMAWACGLAHSILRIIRRYNEESVKKKLPVLEIGIGVCYRDSAPMFLFDGDQRIMISPALNLSDRLSGCSKSALRLLAKRELPFNVYVFQKVADNKMDREDTEEQLVHYNVNGIRLNEEGFIKLSNELSLQCIELNVPGSGEEKTRIHTGRFLTLRGSYQSLIIREARVARVDPIDFHFIQWTSRRYFEVCTNPKISKLVEIMKP